MRIDFHFYTIYALARAAGFSPDDAYVIAYSSQYTDDDVQENKILFENGGEFEPFITAHRILDPHTVSERICKRVWVPFHFLPGNQGVGNEKLLTKANGDIVQEMIVQFLREDGEDIKPFRRHLLGIILHAYADTWSHQSFMGVVDDRNRVNNLNVDGKNIYIYQLAPPLGHAQAGSTPDEPRLAWEYTDNQGDRHRLANADRALEAAKHCHILMSQFMDKFSREFRDSDPIDWPQIEGRIADLFHYQQDLRGCINSWGEAISNGGFGFRPREKDINLIYDEREWFNIAITSESRINNETGFFDNYFTKNENYEDSDLYRFNEAATFYWAVLFAGNKNVIRLGLYN
jgi:hypothetical protein